MFLGKLQIAGAPAAESTGRTQSTDDTAVLLSAPDRGGSVLYGAVALGVLAGAAVSAYVWRQRVRALDLLNTSPLDRAEELISSCEGKLAEIERAFEKLTASR